MSAAFTGKEALPFEEWLKLVEGKFPGVVRVSFGIASSFADAYHFLEFARGFQDRPLEAVDLAWTVSGCNVPLSVKARLPSLGD